MFPLVQSLVLYEQNFTASTAVHNSFQRKVVSPKSDKIAGLSVKIKNTSFYT